MAKVVISNGHESEDFRQWDNLINKLVAGDVIPVIGPDFLVDDDDHPGMHNPHEMLLQDLSESYGLSSTAVSFSDLLFQKDLKGLYGVIGQVFEENPQLFTPSEILKELLSIRQFPFVITTSFTPVVENAMREIWGNGLKVKVFCNNPQKNDDIASDEDLRCPTVYYMFGKVNRSEKTYVLKDTDMLSFCQSWMSEGRPPLLSSVLQKRYLLFLGNNYSDWLCRFIWYSLLKTRVLDKPDMPGMLVERQSDESLLQFMKRIDAFTQDNPQWVVKEMKRRLEARLAKDGDSRFEHVDYGADIFISYSRSNEDIAKSLYEALTREGLKVWYDRLSLGVGDRFMAEIRQGIRSAKFFVPIISKDVERERKDAHVYRKEWQTAMERADEYGYNYIQPLVEKGVDFYSAMVPERMREHNAWIYDSQALDLKPFVAKMRDEVSRLISM